MEYKEDRNKPQKSAESIGAMCSEFVPPNSVALHTSHHQLVTQYMIEKNSEQDQVAELEYELKMLDVESKKVLADMQIVQERNTRLKQEISAIDALADESNAKCFETETYVTGQMELLNNCLVEDRERDERLFQMQRATDEQKMDITATQLQIEATELEYNNMMEKMVSVTDPASCIAQSQQQVIIAREALRNEHARLLDVRTEVETNEQLCIQIHREMVDLKDMLRQQSEEIRSLLEQQDTQNGLLESMMPQLNEQENKCAALQQTLDDTKREAVKLQRMLDEVYMKKVQAKLELEVKMGSLSVELENRKQLLLPADGIEEMLLWLNTLGSYVEAMEESKNYMNYECVTATTTQSDYSSRYLSGESFDETIAETDESFLH